MIVFGAGNGPHIKPLDALGPGSGDPSAILFSRPPGPMSGVISVHRTVRIGDRQLPQDSALGIFHYKRPLSVLVVVAHQMQKTVHCKMGEMMSEGFALAPRLARYGFIGEHDIAEMLARGVLGRK
jgi:hypothetical protein